MVKGIIIIATLFLASCQTTSGDRCAGFKPIRPTSSDVQLISETLTNQLLVYNKTGASLCGWKP